ALHHLIAPRDLFRLRSGGSLTHVLPLSRRPAERAAAYQVQVNVEDAVPGVAAGVEDQPEAALTQPQLAGQLAGPADEASHQRVVVRGDVEQARDVLPGDHQ